MNSQNKKRLYVIFTIAIVALLPTAVFASVIINDVYPVSSNAKAPTVYLMDGPNYKTANSYGLVYAKNTTASGLTFIAAGTTIDINSTSGTSDEYLLNVLEIKNSNSSAATVYLNGSLPTGITMYVNSAPMTATSHSSTTTYSGLGTSYTPGNPISVAKSGTEYISFAVASTTAATGTIAMNY
ncbi:MAG: hypothetical protein QXZ44_06865 [Ferroplasma sp.]